MRKMPYKRNLLIINVVGWGKPFLKGIFVNTYREYLGIEPPLGFDTETL